MLEHGLEMEAATAVFVPAPGNRLDQDMRIGWSISGQHFFIALHALLQCVLNLGDSIEREVGNWYKLPQLIVSMGTSPHPYEGQELALKIYSGYIFFFSMNK